MKIHFDSGNTRKEQPDLRQIIIETQTQKNQKTLVLQKTPENIGEML